VEKSEHIDVLPSVVLQQYSSFPCPLCGNLIDVEAVINGEYDSGPTIAGRIKGVLSGCLMIVIVILTMLAKCDG